jgi:hypothetical protein
MPFNIMEFLRQALKWVGEFITVDNVAYLVSLHLFFARWSTYFLGERSQR